MRPALSEKREVIFAVLLKGKEDTMLKQNYFQKLDALLKQIRTDLSDPIDKAAEAISHAISSGGAIHLYDTGHLLDSEFIGRAGGMMCFNRLRGELTVENGGRSRPADGRKDSSMEGLMRYVLKKSRVQPGDVLVIGSVSGKSALPVDLALTAREMGITVIALTSVSYSSMLKSDHSSGKRLFEAADIVLDNCAPPLDAMVEVPELSVSICPASGISAAVIIWAVTAQVVENLTAKGIRPTIYKSINFPGTAEFNEKEYKRYQETGY